LVETVEPDFGPDDKKASKRIAKNRVFMIKVLVK